MLEKSIAWIQQHPVWTSVGAASVIEFFLKQLGLDLVFGSISDLIKGAFVNVIGQEYAVAAARGVGYIVSLAIISAILYFIFLLGRKSNLHDVAKRDTPLEQASFFIVMGRWPDVQEKPFTASLMGVDISNALSKLHQAALDGYLKIWGKLKHDTVFAEVDPSFWRENDIDFLRAYLGMTTPDKPFSKSFDDGEGRYDAFQVSKSEVEHLFPSDNSSKDKGKKLHTLFIGVLIVGIVAFGFGLSITNDEKPDIPTNSVSDAYWPPLTDVQSKALTDKLRPSVSKLVILVCDKAECRDLARSLQVAFKNAGWIDAKLSTGDLYSIGIEGIQIHPRDEVANQLREMIESTTDLSVGISDIVRKKDDSPTILLTIGPKPF